MPELPEVETIRRQLEKSIVGCRILDVWTDNPKSLQPNPKVFVESIKGLAINEVGRRAKLLQFFLENGEVFVVHLKLTGRLLIRKPIDPKDEYVHVVFSLNCKGGKKESKELELRFADARKFGFMRILPKGGWEKLKEVYGPEPFDDLTEEKLTQVLKKNKRSVKEVLLDQSQISGIGNIYANDALWVARINPRDTASLVEKAGKVKVLLRAIEEVLKEGLRAGGASDQWYLDAYGGKGRYQEHFKVYGRVGQPCLRCGREIRRIVVGGRGTFYCPKCQGQV